MSESIVGNTGVPTPEAMAAVLPAALENRTLPGDEAAGETMKETGMESAGDPDGQEKVEKGKMGKATKKDDAKDMKVPILSLFSFGDKTDILLMIVGTIAAAAAGATQPLMTLLLGDLINAFGKNLGDTDKLVDAVNDVVLRFVYVGLGSAVAGYLEVTCWTIAGERQAARIRSRYLRAILRQDISFFDTDTSTGEVIARMSGDTVLIQDGLGEKVGKFIQLFTTFVGGFIVAFFRSWKLTLVLMAIMPLIIVSGITTMIFISKTTNRTQMAYAGAGALVEQVIGSIRTVASYTGEKEAVRDYDANLKRAETAGVFQGLAAGSGIGFLFFMMFSAYSLALWYGSKLVLNEGLSGGQVINVIFAVLTGSMSISQASPSFGAIAAAQAAAYNIFEVIKRIPPIDVYDMSGLTPDKIKGDVELRNVDFCYPTRPDVVVFSNFSLAIPAGKTVALVGESGSGKSTVVSLIERFYDPQSGSVLVDGVDIKTIQLKWLRQQIGLVSQEPVLFSASVKENIAYGKENATVEEVETAAHLANAAKFIVKIPQGYNTLVGERGIQLSGGQKQRVAIARAILKNPRILLLDEATSALDAESEHVVQDALDRVMTDRTTVVVAHRLTTIRNADMIAVVQRGVIVETGTHNELIRKADGAYSQLIRLQEQYGKREHVAEEPKDPNFVPETAETSDIMARISEHRSSASGSSIRASISMMGIPGVLGGSTRIGRMSAEVRDEILEMGRRSSAAGPDDIITAKKEASARLKNVSIVRLAKLNRPELPLFVVGSIASAAAGLVFPVFGLLLSGVISSFFEPPHQLRKDINFWSIMFLVMASGIAIASPIQKFSFSITGERLIRRVRRMTFEMILRQEISWFDEEDNSSGAISSRLSADAAAVRSLVGDALSLLVQNVATVLAGIIIAFTACWQLALVILALVPLLALQGYGQIKWMQGFGEDSKVKYEEASRVANDGVGSIRTVASFVAEEKISQLYDEKCKGPVRSGIRVGLIAGISLGFANLVLFCTFALSFYVGGKLVQNGDATFKEVFRVFFAITLSSMGVTQTAGLAPDFAKVNLAVNSIFSILDRKSKIDPTDMSGATPKAATGEIEFRDVSFFYPTRPDIQIFQSLSFKVKSGQTLALVGESGSGKSTVVSLIERFYEPQSGAILVDGVNIRKLQLRWLRQQIGLVSQEPVLFDESIQWNIVYGQEGHTSEAEVRAAAEAANAHRFISALPDAYKTRVGERGMQLSGGQKQRVAIARAILREPKILLLDEATSALDAESEHVVQEALDRIMVARTTVVIAHRLSTVRNADIIAVVKDGAIVEHGKHDQLIAKDGAYAALVKLHISSS